MFTHVDVGTKCRCGTTLKATIPRTFIRHEDWDNVALHCQICAVHKVCYIDYNCHTVTNMRTRIDMLCKRYGRVELRR